MKFEIQSVYNWDDPVEILEKYPCLKDYEFEVVEPLKKRYIRIKDENGNPIKQVDFYKIKRMLITVDSLEQLTKLVNEINQPIIISKLNEKYASFNIEIYDGYRE